MRKAFVKGARVNEENSWGKRRKENSRELDEFGNQLRESLGRKTGGNRQRMKNRWLLGEEGE